MTPAQPTCRSMLFVPGSKPGWVPKALGSGADAVILDLEDAVGPQRKAEARAEVAQSLREHAARAGRSQLWVRPNPWDTDLTGADLEAVVGPGLTGLFLPKITRVSDVVRIDALVTHFEIARGLRRNSIGLLVAIETAQAMVRCEKLARAPRVVTLLGSTSPAADVAGSLGFRWTPEGLETLYLRSRVVMACRAAGLKHPIGGLWEDVHDRDGLRAFAQQQLQLGFRGQIVIHPSHVPIVNDVFTPDPDEVERARSIIAAVGLAAGAGDGATTVAGQHVDAAHVQTARELLARVDRLPTTD